MSYEPLPLIRVMALHALAYCERLFYLEEIEEIRVADSSVFAGRRLHEELYIQKNKEKWVTFELSSDDLGIRGKADCVKSESGKLVPYEHKRGRSRKTSEGHSAWPSDRIQVIAYAKLLEQATNTIINEGRIRYHADNKLVRIPIDENAESELLKVIARAKSLRNTLERPPVTDQERLCLSCSLAPVCLPEEERLASDHSFEPIRLFPADSDKITIHISKHGGKIGRSGHSLVVTERDGRKTQFPTEQVEQVVVHGYSQVTAQALHLCAYKGIGVHWLTGSGRWITGLVHGAQSSQRQIRQFTSFTDSGFVLELAKKLVKAKIESQLRFLLRASRKTDRTEVIVLSVRQIRHSLKRIPEVSSLDSLRGYEGIAGKSYFGALPELLHNDLDPKLTFSKRSRRPPKDRFNAALSYGYSLLYGDILQAVISVGLHPGFGFYHQPRSAAQTLVLDLIELFRVPVWDMALIASMNRKMWDTEKDFKVLGEQVLLNESGRKKVIEIYEKRKQEKWKHPVVGYSLTYARHFELEVRLLEKEWCGSPDLFARVRLR